MGGGGKEDGNECSFMSGNAVPVTVSMGSWEIKQNGRYHMAPSLGAAKSRSFPFIMDTSTVISATNLTYSYNSFSPPSLVDINLSLPRGSRTILVGANGGSVGDLWSFIPSS